jgi:hypothetical protein
MTFYKKAHACMHVSTRNKFTPPTTIKVVHKLSKDKNWLKCKVQQHDITFTKTFIHYF